ncbi:hypothetical protein GCM10010245_90870 [Streptomyces spectabilis]|nr:hypothetical protein GCM10010245_90870 [Streptomyces spectabilis]
MCGQHFLFAAQVGDWTWGHVSDQTGMDVLTARTDTGDPAYLAFAFIRIKGSPDVHTLGLTFGDRVAVATQSFAAGPGTVLTLHQIKLLDGTLQDSLPSIDLDSYFHAPELDTLYVENVNRWVRRSVPGTNQELCSVVPSQFRHHNMDRLPLRFSPREKIKSAQKARTLLPTRIAKDSVRLGSHTVSYTVDASRDLNGVGLVYFASYFSFADTALLAYWEKLSRPLESFLARRVIDNRMCYFSNADPGTVLSISVTGYRYPASMPDDGELIDIRITDRHTGELLALNSQHVFAR